jgi:hypothetical protein
MIRIDSSLEGVRGDVVKSWSMSRDEAECLLQALAGVLGAKLTYGNPSHQQSQAGNVRVTDTQGLGHAQA